MTEHENRTPTEISLHRKNENESSPWVTNDRKPLWAYYVRLGTGSRRTMISALHAIATMASKGTESVVTFVWSKLRYSQSAAIRSALAARYKPATVNKMLAALRGVLKECQRLGWMSADDYQKAVDIPNIKAATLLRGRALAPKEIIALQRACSKDCGAAGMRDRAIIALLYGTGLRRSELVNLDRSHCDKILNQLTVLSGKGRKDRLVNIPDRARSALRDWLKLRGSYAGPLFCHVNQAGDITRRRLTGQGIWYILRKRGGEAGVASFSPHDLRRSCITALLANGSDVLVVQQLAGHSDPKTTVRYDRAVRECAQDRMKR